MDARTAHYTLRSAALAALCLLVLLYFVFTDTVCVTLDVECEERVRVEER